MAKIIVLQCNADLGLVSTLEHTDLNKTEVKINKRKKKIKSGSSPYF